MRSWVEQYCTVTYGSHHDDIDYIHKVQVTSAPAVIIQDRFTDFLHNCGGAILVLNEEHEVEGIMHSWYEMYFVEPQDAVQFKLMQQ